MTFAGLHFRNELFCFELGRLLDGRFDSLDADELERLCESLDDDE